jgi:formylglycine-generating enzyme required for sulfatase activity
MIAPPPPPDPDALDDDERPVHPIFLPRYLIARYPVTVGQWRVYYEEVATRRVWTPQRPYELPFEPLDARSVEGVPSHPVVYVSWYDAMDYCRWLTARLRARAREVVRKGTRTVPAPLAALWLRGDESSGGRPWVVTLPSEAEWERSARGRGYAWPYPWKGGWDPNLANAWESGIKGVSAVGAFSGGSSPRPDRVEELSGNVLEWTRSLWGRERRTPDFRYPYQPDYLGESCENVRAGGEEFRVVRGGSFINKSRNLRSAFRYRLDPASRDGGVGFRVVVSPFSALDPLISDNSDL